MLHQPMRRARLQVSAASCELGDHDLEARGVHRPTCACGRARPSSSCLFIQPLPLVPPPFTTGDQVSLHLTISSLSTEALLRAVQTGEVLARPTAATFERAARVMAREST